MLVGVKLGLLWILAIDLCWGMCERPGAHRVSIVIVGNYTLGP